MTGDVRAPGVRPDVTQVFDLDGTRLAALAAATGLVASVPEAPEAPPTGCGPARVAQKQRAGARLCVLNHVSSPAAVARFIAEARRVGATLPFVAGVAVYTDERSARVLRPSPGCTSTARPSTASCARPTRWRPGSRRRSRRRGRCSRSPAWSG